VVAGDQLQGRTWRFVEQVGDEPMLLLMSGTLRIVNGVSAIPFVFAQVTAI
jgi:hypothetical protein